MVFYGWVDLDFCVYLLAGGFVSVFCLWLACLPDFGFVDSALLFMFLDLIGFVADCASFCGFAYVDVC